MYTFPGDRAASRAMSATIVAAYPRRENSRKAAAQYRFADLRLLALRHASDDSASVIDSAAGGGRIMKRVLYC